MKTLDLVSGDAIVIESNGRQTLVLVWPGSQNDIGQGTLRIDGTTRANLDTGIDSRAIIYKINLPYATSVTLYPTKPIRLIGGSQYFSVLLKGRPVSDGQRIRVNVLGHDLTFTISDILPEKMGIVTEDTLVELEEYPLGDPGCSSEENGEYTEKENFAASVFEDISNSLKHMKITTDVCKIYQSSLDLSENSLREHWKLISEYRVSFCHYDYELAEIRFEDEDGEYIIKLPDYELLKGNGNGVKAIEFLRSYNDVWDRFFDEIHKYVSSLGYSYLEHSDDRKSRIYLSSTVAGYALDVPLYPSVIYGKKRIKVLKLDPKRGLIELD